ncbi:MAG: type II toxin-antitoxin system PemK/MazF family toxin [Desulfobacula sp.]|uniref:type II toxin-antitoxin system PemK/MazF family toxin n=1 Tax=Desulfobacula sp. TaxID=2593537 RepID=UPI0025BC43AE|nr:type II toxin-antitoxin system PemK/MazF family toxin [Desulfobacula sp.]MCD4718880.1 type II toxin-antitoxin system PemK/MazF family toxin [Desulfobacula sp.]
MLIKQYEIWIADLKPRVGTETGKIRPVLVIQTNLLNPIHPSTIICPITTNVQKQSELLRVHLEKGTGNVKEACDIMIDQIRAIDNKRLIKRIGIIPTQKQEKVTINLSIIFDLLD